MIATERGLFELDIKTNHLKRVYFSSNSLANQVLSVAVIDENIFIGTKDGMFVSEFNFNWSRVISEFKERNVSQLLNSQKSLYAAIDDSVYEINYKEKTVKEILNIAGLTEDNDDEKFIKGLDIDQERLVVLLKNELLVNDLNTKEVNRSRLGNMSEATGLSLIKREGDCFSRSSDCSEIYISTNKGVFKKRNNAWVHLYQGMFDNDVQTIIKDNKERLFAATGEGLFLLREEKTLPYKFDYEYKEVASLFDWEPTIAQVHAWAINYAEVQPEKISNWRELSKRRALYPNLSIGLDGDQGRTFSDSVYGTSSSGGAHYIAPDDKTYTDGIGWDVSLSWDLGDFIWSTDQTTIDSRSKLMVELREDILDQATRIYFERRREQIELIVNSGLNNRDKLTKQMRVDELTAYLDGLTGGEFSKVAKGEGR